MDLIHEALSWGNCKPQTLLLIFSPIAFTVALILKHASKMSSASIVSDNTWYNVLFTLFIRVMRLIAVNYLHLFISEKICVETHSLNYKMHVAEKMHTCQVA